MTALATLDPNRKTDIPWSGQIGVSPGLNVATHWEDKDGFRVAVDFTVTEVSLLPGRAGAFVSARVLDAPASATAWTKPKHRPANSTAASTTDAESAWKAAGLKWGESEVLGEVTGVQ